MHSWMCPTFVTGRRSPPLHLFINWIFDLQRERGCLVCELLPKRVRIRRNHRWQKRGNRARKRGKPTTSQMNEYFICIDGGYQPFGCQSGQLGLMFLLILRDGNRRTNTAMLVKKRRESKQSAGPESLTN